MRGHRCKLPIIGVSLKLYQHIVGIPMDTNHALFVEDLFLLCYEDFILSFSDNN